MSFLILILVAGLVALGWLVGVYNGLVRLRNQLENAWAQIDVQLKRRTDLIPNLVETVKGYAAHERQTFESIAKARNMALAAQNVSDRAGAEQALSGALKSLFAISESYPELRADQNFLRLQEELASTENKIAFSRQFYNDTVMNYNTRIQTFPTLVIAGPFGFAKRDFFQIDAAEREVPKVGFN